MARLACDSGHFLILYFSTSATHTNSRKAQAPKKTASSVNLKLSF
jgi:hypothetical protein